MSRTMKQRFPVTPKTWGATTSTIGRLIGDLDDPRILETVQGFVVDFDLPDEGRAKMKHGDQFKVRFRVDEHLSESRIVLRDVCFMLARRDPVVIGRADCVIMEERPVR